MSTQSPPRSLTCAAAGSVEPPLVLEAGLTCYELVRSLGQEHHGELLLMQQRFEAGPGGYTVVKRLNPVAMEEDWRRLQEEARLVSQLRHPNIIAVHQLHGTASSPLLLMEYVEGYRLDALRDLATAARKPLSEGLSCYVVSEAAEALYHAYSSGGTRGQALQVIHRDVTPHTLLVGLQGEVKLLDFGLALSQLSGRVSSEGGRFQGSLAYASPEHAALEPLDGRSDLFSLGLVMLELLTGRHLLEARPRFEAELRYLQQRAQGAVSSFGSSSGEMSRERTQALMNRLRALTPSEVQEATSPLAEGLRLILRKVLTPQRVGRTASGAELAQALRDYLWSSGCRYGRSELKQEVATLHEAAAVVRPPPK